MILAAQIILAICLIWAWRGGVDKSALAPLCANFVATLIVCGAMDLGWINRDASTIWQMVIDLATAAAMVSRPGLPRLLSLGYGVNILLYSANLIGGLSLDTTFAVVMGIAYLQLGVASGMGSGGGRRSRLLRIGALSDTLALSVGRDTVHQEAVRGERLEHGPQ